MTGDIEMTVRDIAALVLRRAIGPDDLVSMKNETTWDSLKHIELLFAIEEGLDVRFDQEELSGLTDLERIVASVTRHRGT